MSAEGWGAGIAGRGARPCVRHDTHGAGQTATIPWSINQDEKPANPGRRRGRVDVRATDELLAGLGHKVTAHAVNPRQVAELIARDDPDLSVVVVHDDDDHALDLIEEINEYARGPLIVLLGSHESHFVSSAAERGIDAFARPQFDEEVQGAIELVDEAPRREGAARRAGRAARERAGAARHDRARQGDPHGAPQRRRREAFELMRQQARRSNRRVVELATPSPTATRCCPIAPNKGGRLSPPLRGEPPSQWSTSSSRRSRSSRPTRWPIAPRG